MGKSLVIVESPTKMKTLSKFLGKDFVIRATYGHIKDLPKSKMGVDVEHDFAPQFTVMKGKAKVVADLKKASKEADHVYIGSDPDREGEAIAFHVAEEIGKKAHIQRVLFHEITKKGVLDAIKSPQDLDASMYDAQKTRRILDRLVGYEISPLLWERVKYGLSAGRVQSVAVKLVCEREDEIDAFVKEEYWTVEADFVLQGGGVIKAKLEKIKGHKPKISSAEEAERIRNEIEQQAFSVTSVDEKDRQNGPYAAFKTSSLQQDASSKLRFSPKKTMLVAQKLFEGVEIGKSSTGLITYMRTDSVRISGEALNDVRKLIGKEFGPDYVPAKPNAFKNSKSAQDAHEAIRPTDVTLTPEKMKSYLDKDMLALYTLIWKRFVASQMAKERLHVKTAEITGEDYTFIARGSKVLFDGFTRLYETEKDDEERVYLPDIAKGEALILQTVKPDQHFTSPPPRYSEASLIKTLEQNGIGRPSTYATIVTTIQDRDYVKKEKGSLAVTTLGRTVNTLLTQYFPKVIDVDFTAKMEDGLDLIEEEGKDWVTSLREFYGVFQEELEAAKKTMTNLKKEEKETSIVCDKCGKNMILRWGKNGEYLVCSGRPTCKNKKNAKVDKDGAVTIVEEMSHGACPKCDGNLLEKSGRFGRFIACSNYPECKFTKPFATSFPCPEESCTGRLVERISKKKKKFHGCSRYPECTFASGLQPKEGECPTCGAPVVFSFRNMMTCQRKECGWKSL